ncbi:MAG: NAD(P)H-dependent oxidoreductase [Thermodesulfobacteriota bacterium]|nr:MAG: NAD(P)H-dependent oxidoreductase [Thermodesulfobacteriota bacterium]
MKKLLHIIATPRGPDSRTLKVSDAFLEAFKRTHAGWVVEALDVFKEDLPELTVKRVDGKYMLLGGRDLTGEAKKSWAEVIAHIERFISADGYLLSTPMWNFNIPYRLKHYIDVIVQPKYMFRYTEDGTPEGLVKDKKMVVVATRGGDYTTGAYRAFDFQEPYLRTVFGFVGIIDMDFVVAQPMDASGAEVQRTRLEEARGKAVKAAEDF